MSFYRIDKILNNNVVVAVNEHRERVIITGKGVGFNSKLGDVLTDDQVGRVYVAKSGLANKRLEALFNEIPFACIEAAEQIVGFASAALGRQFSQNLTISLSDHINFVVGQHEAGAYQANLLAEEIERLYPTECAVGRQGLALIERKLGVALDDSEAASIAFHIINNSGPGNTSVDTAKIIAGVEGMLDIIQAEMGLELSAESSRYARLVTHLKFLMRRIIAGEASAEEAGELFLNSNEASIEGVTRCLDAIAAFLEQRFDYRISNAERLYLFVHIVAIAQLR